MPNILNTNFDFEYNGIQKTEIFKKPSVSTPAMADFFKIRPGIGYREQIFKLNPLDKIVKKYESCGRTFTSTNEIFNKTLEVTELEVNTEWCKDQFEGEFGNVFAEQWMKSGIDSFNPDGTMIKNTIDEMLSDALRRDLWRIFSFGDTASGSADYNQLDGLWTQLLAESGDGSSYCVNNAFQWGTDLSDGEALTGLQAMYEGASSILDQMPPSMKYFAVTRSIYDNLMASYESNTTGSELMFTNLTDGQRALKYRGIPVFKFSFWDDFLADPDNPLNGTQQHLAMYTLKDNHFVGTQNPTDLTEITGWYERKDQKYYFEGNMKLGYMLCHCDLTVIATSELA